jgi:tripartite ATP-independent transporter DctM subunit
VPQWLWASLPFLILLVLLMIGYPVAFSLAGVGIIFILLSDPRLLELIPMRIWGNMNEFVLVAVPLFIFMGAMLERSGLADDLLETLSLIFGRLQGGLAISVVVVGAILAATTGIVGASVVTMGILALPAMLRRKYSPELATGTIAAAGTLGQLIPPSIVLVVLGDVMGVAVRDLFVGAVIPGLLLVGLYIVYIVAVSHLRPQAAPPAPDLGAVPLPVLARRVAHALLPPAFLIMAVLGSIFFGIATPTEAAAVGAFGAIVLAFLNRRLSLTNVTETAILTTKLTSMIFILLTGANIFSLALRSMGSDLFVRDILVGLPGGPMGFVVVTMVVIFLLGFPLEFLEITFIVVPILSPILEELGINPIWYALLMAVNLQTAFISPPVGATLFYLKGVAPPGVTMGQIYRGVMPFIALQVLALVLMILFPQIALWLPANTGR